MHNTAKGATIPDPGDDLLAAWDAYDQTVGTIMPTDSIAAARTTLASAEAAGTGPTAAHPWYFDMNNVIYRATGAKSSGGVFTLAPVNEVETYSASASAFRSSGVVPVWMMFGLMLARPPSVFRPVPRRSTM